MDHCLAAARLIADLNRYHVTLATQLDQDLDLISHSSTQLLGSSGQPPTTMSNPVVS